MFTLILILLGFSLLLAVASWYPPSMHWPPMSAALLLVIVSLLLAISIPIRH